MRIEPSVLRRHLHGAAIGQLAASLSSEGLDSLAFGFDLFLEADGSVSAEPHAPVELDLSDCFGIGADRDC